MMTNMILSLKRKTDIVNVSSGAASHPIDGWAMYCSSKSAAKAFFDTVALEHSAVRLLQINPGIVDTDMQQEIRNASHDQFSRLEEFITYKKNNALQTPEEAAKNIMTQILQSGILKKC
jgi:benzil reductase ((S)-benzoin forming)